MRIALLITDKYFCVWHKNRRKHNHYFKLLFSRINLLFGTSKWMSTFEKLYFVWKETFQKSSEVAATKNFFPSPYGTSTACFDECFLFYVIIEKHDFLCKFIVTQRFFATAMFLRSLQQCFERSSYFMPIIPTIILQYC